MRAGAFIKGCCDARCLAAGGHAVPSSATATTAGLVGYRILLLDAADAANQSGGAGIVVVHVDCARVYCVAKRDGPGRAMQNNDVELEID